MKSKKSSGIDIVIYFLSIYFIMDYGSYVIDDTLRYLKYVIPFIAVFFNKSLEKDTAYYYTIRFIKFYFFLFLFFFFEQLLVGKLTSRFFSNCYFILAPLFFVYLLLPFIKVEKIKFYFYFFCAGSILGYIFEKGTALIDVFTHFSIVKVSLEDSTSETESNIYPFVFSFLLIFSIYHKFPRKFTGFLFMFMLFGFKRIVFVGILGIFMAWVVFRLITFKRIQNGKKITSFIIASLATIMIIIYFRIAKGDFDSYVLNHLGISVNLLLQGRQNLYRKAIEFFHEAYVFGMGIGTTDNIIEKYFGGTYVNGNALRVLHSELLRIFLETGAFFYFIWAYYFTKNSLLNFFSFLLFLFLFAMLLTDNIFRYFDCMFTFYFLNILSLKMDDAKLQLLQNNND